MTIFIERNPFWARLLFAFALVLAATFAQAQGAPSQSNYPATVNPASGAPSGTCPGTNQFYLNTSNGNLYGCPTPGGSYTVVASGGGSGTVNANSGNVGAIAFYSAAAGSTTVAPDTNITDASTFFTVGGTDTAIVVPVGSASNPNFQATGTATNTGISLTTTANCFASAGNLNTCSNVNGYVVASGHSLGFTAGNATASMDTNMSRDSAAVMDFGNGTAGNTTAKIQASGYISKGTKFTLSSNSCAATTLTGGATNGSVVSGTTGVCAFTVTMGDTATAPNGWSCSAHDLTTVADVVNTVLPVSATACSFSGTTASGDVIQFTALGY